MVLTKRLLLIVSLIVTVVFSACNSPLHHQSLGDYLKDLFEGQGIFLDSNDFLEPVDDPYLAYAKMLTLVPSSYQSDQAITEDTADDISTQLLSVKDYLLFDGLYGKIDMHEHYRAGGDVEKFLKAAACLGISKVLFVPTGTSPDNGGYEKHQEYLIERIMEEFPDKVIPFCTIDEAGPNAAEVFEACLKAGAKGLKLIGGHPDFYDEPMNSDNMYKIYRLAAEYDVPVLLHGSIINIKGLQEELEHVYADFPEVTFIHAHYASTIMSGINLDICAELLDKYPNLYVDLSMGGGIARYHRYIEKDAQQIIDFIVKYQDRIVYGSDIILNNSSSKDFDWLYDRMKCDIDLHEEESYSCSFGEEGNPKTGFNLDREVLKKIYYDNPRKILGY